MNVTSTFDIGLPQADGRWYVSERHDVGGRTFNYEYLSNGSLSAQLVMEERALYIIGTLEARESARQFVVGTEVAYTKHEFLSRFTPQERIAIRNLSKTDNILQDFMEMLNASGGVYMTLARQGIGYLQTVGILTAERAAIIGGD